ncbi:MAG: class I poly(R)-hydroxyalkanoic acid synthase, partial [Asticcacaulis sp.]
MTGKTTPPQGRSRKAAVKAETKPQTGPETVETPAMTPAPTSAPKRARVAPKSASGSKTHPTSPPESVTPTQSVRPEVKSNAQHGDVPKPDTDPTPPPAETFETLSLNLARAALTAQSALAQAALTQADKGQSAGPDPFNVGPAFTEVMGKLASQPDRLIKAQGDLISGYVNLWQNATQRMLTGAVTPAAQAADKRFNDPQWSENPVFDVIKQSYLLTAGWMNDLVAGVEGADPQLKRRAEFFTKLLTDAFSPSNFLASNPAALKALMESKGESLVRGMEQFARDIERGKG